MELFPAIDLRGGKAVRLVQGDYHQMTVYSDRPEQVAEEFRRLGARNLHLVDLDGAKEGAPVNLETIRSILSLGGFFVEVGGGIRNEQRVAEYLETVSYTHLCLRRRACRHSDPEACSS